MKLVQDCHRVDGNGSYALPIEEREVVTNAGFMQLFIALEEFAEAAFLHFAVGRMSTQRWRATRYLRPTSPEHAHQMLVGTQRFVDWSTPDTIRKLARLYFVDGDPFDGPLIAAHQHWLDMKTVRNSTAHLSRTTQTSLDALRTRWTGTPTSQSTAYDMLLSVRAGGSDSFLAASRATVTAFASAITHR